MVKELLSREEFENDIIKSEKLAIVDFFATWCMPCKMLAPVIDEISNEETEVKFYKLDVDKLRDIAVEYNIKGVPTLIFFKGGEIKETLVGGRDKTELIATIEKHK